MCAVNERRVVITGVGTINPLGNDASTFWRRLVAGDSGIGVITSIDVSDLPTKIGGEIHNFDIRSVVSMDRLKRTDRFAQLLWVATREALEDASIAYDEDDPDTYRAGVSIGTGFGGVHTIGQQHRALFERGPRRLSPFGMAKTLSNTAGGQVSIDFNLRGPNTTTTTACAASANAVGDAANLIRLNAADVMLAAGSEAPITRFGLGGFCRIRATSTRNEDPQSACRPFDAERDGFVMSEGAAALVLEERSRALARGASIYAEVVGYGMSADGYHVTRPRPDGAGASVAIRAALCTAGLDRVDYINAHGTSTRANDTAETAAIKTVFGCDAYRIPMSSTKSMTGHLLGGAGALESLICILALRDGIIPPTINYATPDPSCDLDYVPNECRPAKLRTAMSNSFGFGGHNVALIFAHLEHEGPGRLSV